MDGDAVQNVDLLGTGIVAEGLGLDHVFAGGHVREAKLAPGVGDGEEARAHEPHRDSGHGLSSRLVDQSTGCCSRMPTAFPSSVEVGGAPGRWIMIQPVRKWC